MDPSEQSLLFPYARYSGSTHPEKLLFNANLQEFSQRVTYLCLLQSNGKISPDDVIVQIGELWGQLEQSKIQLNIGNAGIGQEESSE